MLSIEEIVRLSIKDAFVVQPPPALAGRVLLAVERKKRFYAFVKLAIYSAITLASSAGSVIIWRAEGPNIINSEALSLLALLFSDFALVAKYWQEYAISVLESLPAVSLIAVAVFVWVACASLWMTARAYFLLIHRHATRRA